MQDTQHTRQYLIVEQVIASAKISRLKDFKLATVRTRTDFFYLEECIVHFDRKADINYFCKNYK